MNNKTIKIILQQFSKEFEGNLKGYLNVERVPKYINHFTYIDLMKKMHAVKEVNDLEEYIEKMNVIPFIISTELKKLLCEDSLSLVQIWN